MDELKGVYRTTVGQRGRICLPVILRAEAGIEEGETVAITVVGDGTMRVETMDAVKRRLQASFPAGWEG